MCSSAEYDTLHELTDALRLALKSSLINLSGALLAKYLILPTDDNELRNQKHSEAERSARLVELIQMKVQEDPQQYYTFIGVLEAQGRQYYAAILEKLDRKLQQKIKGSNDVYMCSYSSCQRAVGHQKPSNTSIKSFVSLQSLSLTLHLVAH